MQENITIPQNSLYEMLKFQPESILIELFDSLLVSSDSSALTNEEKIEIEKAKLEFKNNETVKWKS